MSGEIAVETENTQRLSVVAAGQCATLSPIHPAGLNPNYYLYRTATPAGSMERAEFSSAPPRALLLLPYNFCNYPAQHVQR